MKLRKKGIRIVFWILLICLIVQIILSFVATVKMFGDYESSYSDYYKEAFTESSPGTGVMPLLGMILLLGGMLILIASVRKGPLLSVCTIILLVFSDLLFILSQLPAHSEQAFRGYTLLIGVVILSSLSLLLIIVYLVMAKSYGYLGRRCVTEFDDAAGALEELRVLYDLDAVTQAEYDERKAKLLADYRLLSGSERGELDGAYVCGQKRVVIADREFSIFVKNKVKWTGTVSETEDAVTLRATDGTVFLLKRTGRDLRAQSGSIYKRMK